jgi:hypothetical protein
MALLIDLWNDNPEQLEDKQVQQIIAFSGAGKLIDGSVCANGFRSFLENVPSKKLVEYAYQCPLPVVC